VSDEQVRVEKPPGRDVLESLEGEVVDGGWKIGAFVPKAPDQTGGFFSRGYTCTSEGGKRAFLKAIDLYAALDSDDLIAELGRLTDGARCEQELLDVCRRMDRVVSALSYGVIREVRGVRLQIPIPEG
jgi:hypothetical protein